MPRKKGFDERNYILSEKYRIINGTRYLYLGEEKTIAIAEERKKELERSNLYSERIGKKVYVKRKNPLSQLKSLVRK